MTDTTSSGNPANNKPHRTPTERAARGRRPVRTFRAPATPGGTRRLTGAIPSRCSRRRRRPASPSWSRSATGGCSSSPFAFYRGAARDHGVRPAGDTAIGLRVQLCGDAHLRTSACSPRPERALVFDINDFDETLPGPWEWDVKRLVASFAIAGRDNGFSTKERDGVLGRRRPVPAGDGRRSPRCATSTSGTRASTSQDVAERRGKQPAPKAQAKPAADRRQGAHEGQPAGVRASSPQLVDGERRIVERPAA